MASHLMISMMTQLYHVVTHANYNTCFDQGPSPQGVKGPRGPPGAPGDAGPIGKRVSDFWDMGEQNVCIEEVI